MNREEALHAVETLAASPAAAWIGNKIVDGGWMHRCMRCGVEETLPLPSGVQSPADVPPGFDAQLYAWMRAFQVAHEGCPPEEGVS